MNASPDSAPRPRRRFLTEAAAGAVGACCAGVPLASGLVAWLDPLSRSGGAGDWIEVADVASVPADGTPVRVTVISGRSDAWTREAAVPVGVVYLRRSGPTDIVALHSVCPHAGCFVDYQTDRKAFFCPCHDSTFAVDGSINDPRSPSPRSMDTLGVEVRGQSVWLRFQNFRPGIPAKVALT
ncbi:MAG: Rieske (2Fe-2S) protein [Proteobacteria bacterium]|nr:Rieske (2Fe-2S) protein [Pseudomonadota bacterium]